MWMTQPIAFNSIVDRRLPPQPPPCSGGAPPLSILQQIDTYVIFSRRFQPALDTFNSIVDRLVTSYSYISTAPQAYFQFYSRSTQQLRTQLTSVTISRLSILQQIDRDTAIDKHIRRKERLSILQQIDSPAPQNRVSLLTGGTFQFYSRSTTNNVYRSYCLALGDLSILQQIDNL